jgi:hypothetical protein
VVTAHQDGGDCGLRHEETYVSALVLRAFAIEDVLRRDALQEDVVFVQVLEHLQQLRGDHEDFALVELAFQVGQAVQVVLVLSLVLFHPEKSVRHRSRCS